MPMTCRVRSAPATNRAGLTTSCVSCKTSEGTDEENQRLPRSRTTSLQLVRVPTPVECQIRIALACWRWAAIRQMEKSCDYTSTLRRTGIAEQTFYRWKRQFDAACLAELLGSSDQGDREHWREEDRKEILMRLRKTGPAFGRRRRRRLTRRSFLHVQLPTGLNGENGRAWEAKGAVGASATSLLGWNG
jgi:hypothetical protein